MDEVNTERLKDDEFVIVFKEDKDIEYFTIDSNDPLSIADKIIKRGYPVRFMGYWKDLKLAHRNLKKPLNLI